jgi:spermidine/putrescine transport system permease protein
MENRRHVAALMLPPMAWLVLLLLVPLGMMVVFSFRTGTFGEAASGFTLSNYRDFAANTAFQRLLWRSFVIALLVSLYSVGLAYPVAYYLAFRAGEKRITLLTILIIPAWTSYLLRVLSWKIILGPSGALNSLLQSIGLTSQPLPILLYNRSAVIITLVYAWIPFVALPIFAALDRIDPRLMEAAADLGAQSWETFLRVTLPLSLPGVIAAFLFVFIPTVGEYVTPALVGGPEGIMYGNIVLDQFLRTLNWPMGSLMSLVMLAAVLAPIFVFSRLVHLTDIAGL